MNRIGSTLSRLVNVNDQRFVQKAKYVCKENQGSCLSNH